MATKLAASAVVTRPPAVDDPLLPPTPFVAASEFLPRQALQLFDESEFDEAQTVDSGSTALIAGWRATGSSVLPVRPNDNEDSRTVSMESMLNETSIATTIAEAYIITGRIAEQIPEGRFLWELITKESSVEDRYSVRLFCDNDWRRVIVSSAIPVDVQQRSLVPCSATADQIWPIVLGKSIILSVENPNSINSVIQSLSGLAVVAADHLPEVGDFSQSILSISEDRHLFDLSTFAGTSSSVEHEWTNLDKPFLKSHRTYLTIVEHEPIVLSIIRQVTQNGISSERTWKLEPVRDWATGERGPVLASSLPDVDHILIDGLDPGLYALSSSSRCGHTIWCRSSNEGNTLDNNKGSCWSALPYQLSVANLSGSYPGGNAFAYTVLFQCNIGPILGSDQPMRIAFHTRLDDSRISDWVGLLIRKDDSRATQEILSDAALIVAPGEYIYKVHVRSADPVAPGTFSVTILSSRAVNCTVMPPLKPAILFESSEFRRRYDGTVLREFLSVSGKEQIAVAIDLGVQPSELDITCRVESGAMAEERSGKGRIVFPDVVIRPGQKCTIDCRLRDRKAGPWSRWRIRCTPGDCLILTPSTEYKEKLDTLVKSWQDADPGRSDRSEDTRRRALEGLPELSSDEGLKGVSDAQPLSKFPGQDPTIIKEKLTQTRRQYNEALAARLIDSKRRLDEHIADFKATIEADVEQMTAYSERIAHYDTLLDLLNNAVDEGDIDSILAAIPAVVSDVPEFKQGVALFHAYETCLAVCKESIRVAIEANDIETIAQIVGQDQCSALPPIRHPLVEELDSIQRQGMGVVWQKAAEVLTQATAETDSAEWNVDAVREALQDPAMQTIRNGKYVPNDVLSAVDRAEAFLAKQPK